MKIDLFKIKTKREAAIFLILFFMFVISFTRIIYFGSVTTISASNLLLKNEDEKRLEQYGDMYLLFEEVKNIPSNNFIIISKDDKAYFFGRYQIYPKHLINDQTQLNSVNYALIILPIDISKLENLEFLGFKVIKKIYKSNGEIYGFIMKK